MRNEITLWKSYENNALIFAPCWANQLASIEAFWVVWIDLQGGFEKCHENGRKWPKMTWNNAFWPRIFLWRRTLQELLRVPETFMSRSTSMQPDSCFHQSTLFIWLQSPTFFYVWSGYILLIPYVPFISSRPFLITHVFIAHKSYSMSNLIKNSDFF